MKYKWTEKPTCDELSEKLGCEIDGIKRGIDEETGSNYVEIDLSGEDSNILAKLDIALQGMEREGGRDAVTVISENINLEYPNPQKEAYKLSQLYGLTHAELDIYIDNNVTDLASAREFVRKMAHVILWLVKQTKLDEL